MKKIGFRVIFKLHQKDLGIGGSSFVARDRSPVHPSWERLEENSFGNKRAP